MIALTLNEIAAALNCSSHEPDPSIDSIVTDSRKVDYGSLFAALPGSRVDGHDYDDGKAALERYVRTWPERGYEFRKQLIFFQDWPLPSVN